MFFVFDDTRLYNNHAFGSQYTRVFELNRDRWGFMGDPAGHTDPSDDDDYACNGFQSKFDVVFGRAREGNHGHFSQSKSFKYLKFKVSCMDPSLLKVSNKPQISQSLILGHVTTVTTNQNTGNSQIL